MVDWRDLAACKGMNPELFYAEPGRNDDVEAARKICKTCPVRKACLEYSLLRHEFGFWGGKTEEERKRIRGQRARDRRKVA